VPVIEFRWGRGGYLASVVFPFFEHVYGITDLSSPSPGGGILYASRANSRFACAPYRASKANRACQWSVCVVGLHTPFQRDNAGCRSWLRRPAPGLCKLDAGSGSPREARRAVDHAASYGGKPGPYLLIPHDAIAENMTIEGLAQHYAVDVHHDHRLSLSLGVLNFELYRRTTPVTRCNRDHLSRTRDDLDIATAAFEEHAQRGLSGVDIHLLAKLV
jgi:hypothetical protein